MELNIYRMEKVDGLKLPGKDFKVIANFDFTLGDFLDVTGCSLLLKPKDRFGIWLPSARKKNGFVGPKITKRELLHELTTLAAIRYQAPCP